MDAFTRFDVGAIPPEYVPKMCEACSRDELHAALDSLVAAYPAMTGETCGGVFSTYAGGVGGARYQIDITKLLLDSMCMQNEVGRSCWEPDMLPAAIQASNVSVMLTGPGQGGGLGDIIRDIGSVFSFDTFCGAFRKAGCCLPMLLEGIQPLLRLNCLGAPTFDLFDAIATRACDLPRSCPSMPMPPENLEMPQCPILWWTTLGRLANVKSISDTKYGDCVLDTKVPTGCPTDFCDMY